MVDTETITNLKRTNESIEKLTLLTKESRINGFYYVFLFLFSFPIFLLAAFLTNFFLIDLSQLPMTEINDSNLFMVCGGLLTFCISFVYFFDIFAKDNDLRDGFKEKNGMLIIMALNLFTPAIFTVLATVVLLFITLALFINVHFSFIVILYNTVLLACFSIYMIFLAKHKTSFIQYFSKSEKKAKRKKNEEVESELRLKEKEKSLLENHILNNTKTLDEYQLLLLILHEHKIKNIENLLSSIEKNILKGSKYKTLSDISRVQLENRVHNHSFVINNS